MNSASITLIKNSRIITEKDDFIFDILIKNEKIISIEKNIREENNFIVYDAKGLLAFPGGAVLLSQLSVVTGQKGVGNRCSL